MTDNARAPTGPLPVPCAGPPALGAGARLFDTMVRDGRIPAAVRINARTVWARLAAWISARPSPLSAA
jgi:hypothetical protein